MNEVSAEQRRQVLLDKIQVKIEEIRRILRGEKP